MRRDFSDIAIIGAGKVGCNFARFFNSRSLRLTALITTRPDAINAILGELKPQVCSDEARRIPGSTQAIFICVPDPVIPDVVRSLNYAAMNAEDVMIAHTSGMKTSDEFRALSRCTAVYGSFHPIQSFDTQDIGTEKLQSIACGIEGDTGFLSSAAAFAEQIGWRPIVVKKERKALYHAACVFAGNFIPALAVDALFLLKDAAGIIMPSDALLPMMNAVLDRIASQVPGKTLTGPAVRGDHVAIAAHLEALVRLSPELAELYSLLTQRILAFADPQPQNRIALDAILEKYSPHHQD